MIHRLSDLTPAEVDDLAARIGRRAGALLRQDLERGSFASRYVVVFDDGTEVRPR